MLSPPPRRKEILLSPFADNENGISPPPKSLSPKRSPIKISPKLSPNVSPKREFSSISDASSLYKLEIDKLKQEVKGKKEEKSKLMKEVEDLQLENESLRASNHNNELETEVHEQKQVIDQLNNKVQQLEADLKLQLEEKTTILSMSEFRIKAIKRDVTAKEQVVEKLQSKCNTSEQANEAYSNQIKVHYTLYPIHYTHYIHYTLIHYTHYTLQALQKEMESNHQDFQRLSNTLQLRKVIDTGI